MKKSLISHEIIVPPKIFMQQHKPIDIKRGEWWVLHDDYFFSFGTHSEDLFERTILNLCRIASGGGDSHFFLIYDFLVSN